MGFADCPSNSRLHGGSCQVGIRVGVGAGSNRAKHPRPKVVVENIPSIDFSQADMKWMTRMQTLQGSRAAAAAADDETGVTRDRCHLSLTWPTHQDSHGPLWYSALTSCEQLTSKGVLCEA